MPASAVQRLADLPAAASSPPRRCCRHLQSRLRAQSVAAGAAQAGLCAWVKVANAASLQRRETRPCARAKGICGQAQVLVAHVGCVLVTYTDAPRSTTACGSTSCAMASVLCMMAAFCAVTCAPTPNLRTRSSLHGPTRWRRHQSHRREDSWRRTLFCTSLKSTSMYFSGALPPACL